MTLTPIKELGDFDHSLVIPFRRLAVGQTVRGDFFPDSTYFAEVEFVSDNDALAKVISHTDGCPFQTGQRIRLIFVRTGANETRTA